MDYAVKKQYDDRGQLVSTQYLDEGTVSGTKRGNDSSGSSDSNKAARPMPPPPVGAMPMSGITDAALTPVRYDVSMVPRSSHVTISRIELDEMCDNFSRAEAALSHAAAMASKIARAFDEETMAVKACRHHLERLRRS